MRVVKTSYVKERAKENNPIQLMYKLYLSHCEGNNLTESQVDFENKFAAFLSVFNLTLLSGSIALMKNYDNQFAYN